MRIVVDMDRCELHGQCVVRAPELFAFGDDGELLVRTDPPAELEPLAREAAALCPAAAIEVAS